MSEREEKIRQRREALERRIKQRRARRKATTGGKILDVAKQAALGMNEGLLSTSIGINELLGLEGQAAKDREVRRKLREDVGPSLSKAGTIAGVGGRLGYEGAEFIATGAGVLKGAKAAGALAKGAKSAKVAKAGAAVERAATVTKNSDRAKKLAASIAGAAPLNIAKSQGREESAAEGLAELTGSETLSRVARSRPGRAAFEVALDAVAGGAIEGIGVGVKHLKNIKARRAAKRRLEDYADEAPASTKSGDALRDVYQRKSRRRRGRLLPAGEKPATRMPGEISPEAKLEEVKRQTMLDRAKRVTADPPTTEQVIDQVNRRARDEDLPREQKLLGSGARQMPGEITPDEKLQRVQRETMLSIAQKTLENPPTSDEVIERVIARRREQEGSRNLEREIRKALGSTPRRSAAGQMIEMDVRKKHGAYKSPLTEPFEARETPAAPAQPPRERLSIEEQQRMMEEPAAAKAAEEEATIEARYRRTSDAELLARARAVFERMSTLDPTEYRHRHRIGDDARILREIERVARKRGLVKGEDTLEDAAERFLERDGIQDERPGGKNPDGFDLFSNPIADPKVLKHMLRDPISQAAIGAGAGAAAGGDEHRGEGALAGVALATGSGAVVRGARPKGGFYSRLERAVDNAAFEKGTVEQWKAATQKNVAKGEREWRHFDATLERLKDARGIVTRAQLRKHFEDFPFEVKETLLGKPEVKVIDKTALDTSIEEAEQKWTYKKQQMQRLFMNAFSVDARNADLNDDSSDLWQVAYDIINYDADPVTATRRNMPEVATQLDTLTPETRAHMETQLRDHWEEYVEAHNKWSELEGERTLGRTPERSVEVRDNDVADDPQYSGYKERGGKRYREALYHADAPRRPLEWKQLEDGQEFIDGPGGIPGRVLQVKRWTTTDDLGVEWSVSEYHAPWIRSPLTGEAMTQAIARNNQIDRPVDVYKDGATAMRSIDRMSHGDQGKDFYSGHFDGHERNLLAHSRFQDFDYTPPGASTPEKVLYIEEMQSDWHQQGRERGYRDPQALLAAQRHKRQVENDYDVTRKRSVPLAKLQEIAARYGVELPPFTRQPNAEDVAELELARNALREWDAKTGDRLSMLLEDSHEAMTFRRYVDWETVDQKIYQAAFRGWTLAEKIYGDLESLNVYREALHAPLQKARSDAAAKEIELERQVPDAPMKQTQEWSGHLIKRAIERAVQQGHDRIALTTGTQQGARWNDQVERIQRIEYYKAPVLHIDNGREYDAWFIAGVVDNGEPKILDAIPDDELEQKVGLQIARKMRANEGREITIPEALHRDNQLDLQGMRNQHARYDAEMARIGDYPTRADDVGRRRDLLARKLALLEDPAFRVRVLDTDQLLSGGEGFRSFYDQIVPRWIRDYEKQLGVPLEIEPIQLFQTSDGGRPWRYEGPLPDQALLQAGIARAREEGNDVLARFFTGLTYAVRHQPDDETLRRNIVDNILNVAQDVEGGYDLDTGMLLAEELGGSVVENIGDAPKNLSIKITPELKKKVLEEGQPMWAGAPVPLAAAAAEDDEENGNRKWFLAAAGVVGAGVGIRAARRGRIRGGSMRVPVSAHTTKQASAAAKAAVNADEFANIRKFALDESGEARLREAVQEVVASREMAPKERITWDKTREIAERIGLDVTSIAREKVGRLSGPEMLAIRNLVTQNIQHAEQLAKRMFNPDLGDEKRSEAARLIGMLDAQNDALLGRFVKERTQAGRDLNNLKIVAKNSLDPAVWFARAKRILGDRPLTDEHRHEIMRLLNASDRDGLARFVAGMREVTAIEKLVTLWKAGLLTAPTTHLANFLGNTTMALLETAKDAPAVVFDRLIGAMTGNATKGSTSVEVMRASLRGARKGFRQARRVIKGEQANDALLKYDFAREIDFENAFLDRYTKTVFRALGASDRVFRGMALERSLAEQARAVAKQEGAKGSAFAARVRQLQADPTDAMVLRAIADAELATFTNRGALGQAAQGLRRPLGAVGDILIPFTMTPANVVSRAAEYSPLGMLQAVGELLYRATRGELDEAMQRKLVDRMGRSAIGTLPLIAGYVLAERGLMTAGRPKDTSTQDQWSLEGKQENAIKLGGKWRSLERLSPLGNLLVLGAHLYQAEQEPDATALTVALAGAASIGQTVSEQSFLEGVTRAGDAIRDSRGASKRWAKSMAGSVVPNVVGRAARALDPFERETETPVDAIKARIPGMRQQLPKRIDQLGREVRRETGAAGAFADPFASTEDKAAQDAVVGELERTGATITNLKRQKGEPRARFQKRRRLYGRVVERALVATIESEEYRRIPAVAKALAERHPRFKGRDAAQLARELQQAELEDVVRNVRRQLTVATKP
jgi:hypothetical protein